jgi:hypothetical protein
VSLSLSDTRLLHVPGGTGVHFIFMTIKTATSLHVFTLGVTLARQVHNPLEHVRFVWGSMERLFRIVRISCAVTALVVGASFSANAQGRVCPAVVLSSAALSSNGELGLGPTIELVRKPAFNWSSIRTETDPTACYVDEAKALMKASCSAFLSREGALVSQPANSACSLEREALNLSADENLRLKRVIRRLKARLNQR